MIILKSEPYTVSQILKKTKAKFFGDLKVGDQIQFSLPLKAPGGSSNGIYATYVKCSNLENGDTIQYSLNQLGNMLKNFVLTE